MNLDLVRSQFAQHRIGQMQLDPYGFCNAKCWFCPVKYKGNPEHAREHMSVDLLYKIISNLIQERSRPDGLVSPGFGGFYTAHYNEVLLYRHFEDLLRICQEFKLCFMVLSNGIPFSPENADLISRYPGVVNGICLNIPAFEPELWSRRAGMNVKLFDRLVSNVRYVMQKFPHMVKMKTFSIQVNGSNEYSWLDRGGWLTKGPEFPNDMDLTPFTGELASQAQRARDLFPGVQVFEVPSLIDRAGSLDHIMTNKDAIVKFLQKGDATKKVVRCGNGFEIGGRPVGWIHINSIGQAFLCCNDYDMDVVVGDFKTQELRDFWGKEEHIRLIAESYETICRTCASAHFEE